MKRWLLMVLGLLLVSAVWGQETLALSVHKSVTQPEGVGIDRHFEFFTDVDGRISRFLVTDKGTFQGEPDQVHEYIFSWDEARVQWVDVRDPSSLVATLRFEAGVLRYRLESVLAKDKFSPRTSEVKYSSGNYTSWEDGKFRYSWTKTDGFQSKAIDGRNRPSNEVEYATSGSCVSSWTPNGFEDTRLLLNRTPKALLGTYFMEYENQEGWYPAGELSIAGIGLWNPDPTVRLVHAYVIQWYGLVAEATPFVFDQRFLK